MSDLTRTIISVWNEEKKHFEIKVLCAFNKKACVIAVGAFFKMLPGIKRHNQRKHLKQKAAV